MKKAISVLLTVLTLIIPLSFVLGATEVPVPQCGANLTYEIDFDTGTLTVAGSGKMYDYSAINKKKGSHGFTTTAPWFEYASSIKAVQISEGVTSVGDYAFAEFKSLISVSLPSSLTQIGDCSFEGCSELGELIIPNGVRTIGTDAFYECNSLSYNKYSTGNYLGSESNPYFYLVSTENVYVSSCIINENTKFIGDQAFFSCCAISSLTIPESVTDIGVYVFNGCNALKYTEYQNGLYLGNESNPYLYFAKVKSNGITDININSNTKIIGYNAFYGCESLNSVAIPSGVESVPYKAFYGCKSLRNIFLPDSIERIKDFAFYGCEELESISFSSSCKMIGVSAFEKLPSLTTVRYFGTEAEWNKLNLKPENEALLTCNIIFNPGEHPLSLIERREATYTKEGNIEYFKCRVCGRLFADEYAQTELSAEDVIIARVLLPFGDVQTGSWYYDSVAYCTEKGYFGGMYEGIFAPDEAMTREQFAQVLFNFSKEDKADWQGDTGFVDVPSGQWYSPAIKWAKENEITSGMQEGVFGLGEKITREQLATLLKNYAEKLGFDVSSRADLNIYTDKNDISAWAYDSVGWAVAEGLIYGTSANTLSPSMTTSRAVACRIFAQFDVNVVENLY